MRKALYALTVFGFAGILLAADPFEGTWKLNAAKSKFTQGALPKEETIVIAQQGDQLQVTITGTDSSGSPISVKYTAPAAGGPGKIMAGPWDGVATKRMDANNRVTMYMKGGKNVRTSQGTASQDGKTMTVTTKGVDTQGNPVAGTLVFDNQ